MSKTDGSKIRVIHSRTRNPTVRLHHIFALSVFEDFVYWSDWETKTIERCHKYSGQQNSTILTSVHKPMDIQVLHPMRQPETKINPCENNGGCDSLCLLIPGSDSGYPNKVCQCPQNFVLNDDGLTCRANCSAIHFEVNMSNDNLID